MSGRDPLAAAIVDGTLDATQRAALADLVSTLAHEMAGDAVAVPGTLLDHAVVEAGRWGTLRRAWGRLHGALYPRVVNR